jgi:membrane-associated phospholipid phosphatase
MGDHRGLPLGIAAMSLSGGTATGAPGSWPHWARANVGLAMATLGRPRLRAVQDIRARVLAAGLMTIVLVAAAMVFADAPLAMAARQLPAWVHAAFAFVTDFGKSGWFLWPTGIVLLAIAVVASPALAPLSRLVLAAIAVRAGFLFAAIALPSLFATIIKRLIGRARPFVGDEADPFLYMPLSWPAAYASMPSGHATTAFAAAIAVALVWPRLRWPMLVYAVIIATSRVVLDAHYLSDVIAGTFVGSIGALMVRDWFARRHLGFTVDAKGAVQPLPGPSWSRVKRVAGSLIAP